MGWLIVGWMGVRGSCGLCGCMHEWSRARGGTPAECAPLSCSLPPFPALQREEARKAAAQALLEEVAAGNAELAERKRQQKAAEAAENLQIAEYIRQRDAREQVGLAGWWAGGLG